MQTTTVYLIRHGEVDNPTKAIYGRTVDVSLTTVGFNRIKALARNLKNEGVEPTVIISSPLTRAKQSAEAIREIYGEIPVILEDDFQEADVGNLVFKKELNTDWLKSIGGDVYSYKGSELTGIKIEPPEEQAQRVIHGLQKAVKQYQGKTVFVVTHGDPSAFSMWRLLHPEGELPSISELAKNEYLKKGEAFRIVFDGNGKVVEKESGSRLKQVN